MGIMVCIDPKTLNPKPYTGTHQLLSRPVRSLPASVGSCLWLAASGQDREPGAASWRFGFRVEGLGFGV